MEYTARHRKKDEDVTERLRSLFELRGFTQTRVNKFEDYNLYAENKNFLDAERIITFPDPDGKLMALKPDVTLSIVRNCPARALNHFEKLFYIDEVCRLFRATREYRMLRQVGVELIGPRDSFGNLEILDLALESLRAVSPDHVLDLSHLGFVSGLLDTVEMPEGLRARLLEALHSKSAHQMADILGEAGISGAVKARFTGLAELSGNILDALPKAKSLIASTAMDEAWKELVALGNTLRDCGLADRVNLDFSVVNDLDYYNGLIFLGYVKGVPDVVLTGGRYDNLMRKMGKASGAIGFAVFLSELNTYFRPEAEFEFDILLTYNENCDRAALLRAVRDLNGQGKSVRLERAGADIVVSCREHLYFGLSGLEESGC